MPRRVAPGRPVIVNDRCPMGAMPSFLVINSLAIARISAFWRMELAGNGLGDADDVIDIYTQSILNDDYFTSGDEAVVSVNFDVLSDATVQFDNRATAKLQDLADGHYGGA